MKSILFILVLIAATVIGVGFYRGWFSVLWESSDGKGHITGTIDGGKIEGDLQKVKNVGQP